MADEAKNHEKSCMSKKVYNPQWISVAQYVINPQLRRDPCPEEGRIMGFVMICNIKIKLLQIIITQIIL